MSDITHFYAHATMGAAAAVSEIDIPNAEFVKLVQALRDTHGDDHDFTRADVETQLRKMRTP